MSCADDWCWDVVVDIEKLLLVFGINIFDLAEMIWRKMETTILLMINDVDFNETHFYKYDDGKLERIDVDGFRRLLKSCIKLQSHYIIEYDTAVLYILVC